MIRLAIVDDHQMVLAGLRAWLHEAADDVRVVIQSSRWTDLLSHPEFPVDVVLLDLDLGDGVPPALRIATLRAADVPTVIISTLADPETIRGCLAAGAHGYVPKSEPAADLVLAVRRAARREPTRTPALDALLDPGVGRGTARRQVPRLSPQETRALVLYASGLPMKSVARQLGVGHDTAKGYIDRVRDKYAECGRPAGTKVELYRQAMADGLLPGGLTPNGG